MTVLNFLRNIPLFADLGDDDLQQLCAMTVEVRLKAGEILFTEGSPGDMAYIIQEGFIEISKASNERSILLSVRGAGDVFGEMALLQSAPRNATVSAKTDVVLLGIGQEEFNHLIDSNPSAAKIMLSTVTDRLRSTWQSLRQNEKLAQIGTLTAGIAHELNNPAAATRRGADQLQEVLSQLQRLQLQIGQHDLTSAQVETLQNLEGVARAQAALPERSASLERSDRQAEIEEWLEGRGIENSWEVSPSLNDMDYTPAKLKELSTLFPNDLLEPIINWLGKSYNSYKLLQEITLGASRISEIVKALKSYVYLDQAPVQLLDLHEGLDNTLVILRSKLKQGVNVTRLYEPDLPRIQAYGSELNQVWTNLIDNAIDAMNGHGEIIIRTRREGDWVCIEIEDNGPGIPDDIQTKVFTPFFTTKAVGKGTGLGLSITLNIIQKHGGEIKVESQPGRTCFQVQLPVSFDALTKSTPR